MKKDLKTCERTPYGFLWGTADIRRLISDDRGLVLGIDTPRDKLQIYITPTGKLRVFRNGKGELKNGS